MWWKVEGKHAKSSPPASGPGAPLWKSRVSFTCNPSTGDNVLEYFSPPWRLLAAATERRWTI